MLKTLRRNRKSLMGILAICAIVLVMTGFGVGFRDLRSIKDDFAVKVGDAHLSRSEFVEQKRSILERYRQMFGPNFADMEKGLVGRLNQQIADQFIADSLIDAEARRREFFAPEGEVQRVLVSELFQGGFDPAKYAAFLQGSGMSAKQFENKIREDSLRKQFTTLLADVASPSKAEITGMVNKDETTYDVSVAEFTPAQFIADVNTSDDAKLKSYYDDNTTDYELPARVSYDYIVFDPATFKDSVEVSQEDIELYYVENETKFSTNEEVKVRHIVINIPKGSDPAKIAELRKKAEEVRSKASADEVFEKLVSAHSDDALSKANGGDLGWVKRGARSKAFDEAVFKLRDGGVADVIATDANFEIVKVEGYKPSTPKPLQDVKAEIIEELKRRDAPSYTADKAQQFYDEYTKFAGSMKEFADAHKLAMVIAPELLSKDKDPNPTLKGLTDQVLQFSMDKKQLIELGERSVIVSVRERRDSEIPDFATVKARVIEDFKKQESIKLAKNNAQAALASLKDGSKKTLVEAVSAYKVQVKDEKNIGKNTPRSAALSNPDVAKAIFARSSAQNAPDRVFEVDSKYYLVKVDAVKTPDASVVASKVSDYQSRAASEAGQILSASLTNKLKSAAKVEIAPGILGEG